jgi:hypothetical protein
MGSNSNIFLIQMLYMFFKFTITTKQVSIFANSIQLLKY